MRKTIFLWMLGIMTMLASCSQSEELLQNATDGGTSQVKINVQAPEVQTRAVVTGLTRYVCEVYEGTTATGTAVQHYESATGSFVMDLKKETAYSFLFWADKGTPKIESEASEGKYDVTDLKAVRMTGTGEEGYYGSIQNKIITTADNEGLSVTLRHAVAKIIIENTSDLVDEANNNLKVTYPQTFTFNVGTETTTITETPVVRTFSVAHVKGEVVIDYIFAPKNEAQLGNLKLQLNSEQEKTIPNVPIQLNYITRVKGALSSSYYTTFTVSNEVEDFMGGGTVYPIK